MKQQREHTQTSQKQKERTLRKLRNFRKMTAVHSAKLKRDVMQNSNRGFLLTLARIVIWWGQKPDYGGMRGKSMKTVQKFFLASLEVVKRMKGLSSAGVRCGQGLEYWTLKAQNTNLAKKDINQTPKA